MNKPLSEFFSMINFTTINGLFQQSADAERWTLFEHEVYRLLEATGAITAPETQFIPADCDLSGVAIPELPGDKVVLKIVSPTIIHKTEAGGVQIVANKTDLIRSSAAAMLESVPTTLQRYLEEQCSHEAPDTYRGLTGEQLRQAIQRDILGVLLVQFIPAQTKVFGSELLVGLRNTREFGMTISAGLGGTDTELYAEGFRKGLAVTSASTEMTDGKLFFEQFRSTLAYKALSGQIRGRERVISDEQLIKCFDTIIELGNYYSPGNVSAPFTIEELEINPFAFSEQGMIPLDGMCRFETPGALPLPRPVQKLDKLFHPSSIGIIGVSAEKMNFGRIILGNLLASGYDRSKVTIIRPGTDRIDGVSCTESLSALEHKLDLLIVAVAAEAVFDLVDELIETDCAESVMLIPGGLGETEASRERTATMMKRINAAHAAEGGGPIFLGGNCLGVVSHAGQYDSWFIPKEKLPHIPKKQQRNSALVSQSGAFMVTRMSRNPWFDPQYLAALGNQNDITHGDMLAYFSEHPEIDVIGVYVEGFNDLDGLSFAKSVRHAVSKGKQVIFYKAGQSDAGRDAAMGHTASIAGDYSICESIISQAGAIIAKSLSEFNDLFYLAGLLHNKLIAGNRLGAISGAGFEAVGMADSIRNGGFSLQMATPEPATRERLRQILAAKNLDALMEVRNPFDINPGADDETHIQCTEALCEDSDVDAVVVGLDPMSPMMRTLESSSKPDFDIHSPQSIAEQLPQLVASQDKPILGVIDGGELYTPLVEKLKDRGVAVFRSCDHAVQALTKYIEGRLRAEKIVNRY